MQPSPEPPISGALWQRLKPLDCRCCISIWREDQWLVSGSGKRMAWSGVGGPPHQYRRAWRVRIFPKGSANVRDYIDTVDPLIADALLAAIQVAEARGWHRPA